MTEGLVVISAMITPALLILATGSLVNSAYSRYGRLFDRARALSERIQSGEYDKAKDSEMFVTFLRRYESRLDTMRRVLRNLFFAVACFVSSSLAIALVTAYLPDWSWLPASLTILGAFSLLLGAWNMLKEALEGGNQVHEEIGESIKHLERATGRHIVR